MSPKLVTTDELNEPLNIVILPVTPKEPVICAEPEKGNPTPVPVPPTNTIDAVLADTVATTPLPLKLKNVAVPCAVPSSATVIADIFVVIPEVPDVPLVPEVPEVPAEPFVPAVTLLPLIIYIVFASACPAATKLAYEAEVKVITFVTGGTFVYVSYIFDITLPLNPPIL